MKFSEVQVETIKTAKAKIQRGLTEKLMDPLIKPDLHQIIVDECVLSGGAISSCLRGQTPNDFDLYFKTYEGMDRFTKHMALKQNQSVIKDSDGKYSTTLLAGKLVTANATTLFNDLQFITLSIFEEQQMAFDFIHCKPYYDIKDAKLYISKPEYESIANLQLIVNNNNSVGMKRLNKFKDRGWTFQVDQLASE